MNILIIDDEEVVRSFLLRIFSLKGVKVKAVEDGAKAIEAVKAEHFDIFFVDVMMPGLNGLETLRELKKISPQSKYVMMTGYAVDDILKEAVREGASISIKKPFDIQQLTDILENEFGSQKGKKSGLKILVVDDDPIVLSFFRKLLRDYEVTTVASGKEALEQVEAGDFDLLFLDISLKDMSGLELCNKILRAKPGTEIIVITGDPTRGKEAESIGVRAFFWKPFEIDKILKEVNTLNQQKYK
ncbi:MAG: response regulator [Candidatus Omnitrophota bacterium]|jgi:DNA-binding NtrC family response regulator